MREEWREATLGKVVTINPESLSTGQGSTFRYVDLSSVTQDTPIDESSLPAYSRADAPGRARRVIRKGDVLVSTVRPYLRGFASVPCSLDGQVASTGFTVLRAIPTAIDPLYVWALIRLPTFAEHLMQLATGSNYPAVRPQDVASFPILLPPLDEQRRIVDLIAAVDEAIGASASVAQISSQVATAILGDYSKSTDSRVRVGDTVELRYGRALKEAERALGNTAVFGSAGPVGSHTAPNSSRAPCIVVGRKGAHAPATLPLPIRDENAVVRGYRGVGGAGSVRWSPEACWVIDTAYEAIPRAGMDAIAVFWMLVLADLPSVATKTTLPGLAREAAYRILVPDLTIGRQAANVVDTVESLQRTATRALAARTTLETLRSALLSDLLSGNHEIPASYDAVMG
jgi:hypothetical protein